MPKITNKGYVAKITKYAKKINIFEPTSIVEKKTRTKDTTNFTAQFLKPETQQTQKKEVFKQSSPVRQLTNRDKEIALIHTDKTNEKFN